jgi:hypothetical protein
MIDNIEVLQDGASAIYGSDAVGGVINIILKKDYNGWETGQPLRLLHEPGPLCGELRLPRRRRQQRQDLDHGRGGLRPA